MIVPAEFRGAAFGTAADGDGRNDLEARSRIAAALAIPERWACLEQVHGASVLTADRPGRLGEADAMFTSIPGLPLAVGTADCVPVVIEGTGSVAVVHAGWRGVAAGVVAAAATAMQETDGDPLRAAIGPAIGPCCYEVGEDVLARLGDYAATTAWGTPSIDLPRAAAAQLGGDVELWVSRLCTRDDPALYSHRRDDTRHRQVTIGWLPAA